MINVSGQVYNNDIQVTSSDSLIIQLDSNSPDLNISINQSEVNLIVNSDEEILQLSATSNVVDLLAIAQRQEINLSYQGLVTEFNWGDYAILYEPSTETLITGGTVIDYSSQSETIHRFIPEPYDYTLDAFYQSFDGLTLSGFITRRKR